MKKISVVSLKPGLVLASNVTTDHGIVKMKKGVPLKSSDIDRLNALYWAGNIDEFVDVETEKPVLKAE